MVYSTLSYSLPCLKCVQVLSIDSLLCERITVSSRIVFAASQSSGLSADGYNCSLLLKINPFFIAVSVPGIIPIMF